MALRIVAESTPTADTLPGITKSSTCSRDVFSGPADALVAAGLVALDELQPQEGRPHGVTAFLPGGEPCPPSRRAWREPGFRVIRLLDDGSYRLEVTVCKEVQAWRRKQKAAAEHEAEQERINKEVAEYGHKYRNWVLRHDFSGRAETWEGTKGQLQAIGIGVGLQYPGEPGAPEYVYCKCPLGFDVRIYLPQYERAKAAAGIYLAQSFYKSSAEESKHYVPYAPGVLLEVWADGWTDRDFFVGSAEALVAANLVPSVRLFPGQPGTNKCQASYRKDWTPSTTSGRQDDWAATICKRGKGRFIVEVPVSNAEFKRRKAARDERKEEEEKTEAALAKERRELRQLAIGGNKTVEEFRAERMEEVAFDLKVLWRQVFERADGALRFDIPEDSELMEELADAFQTIRDAVQSAEVTVDKQLESELNKRLKLTAARNDKGLQSLLGKATHLRLVHSSPEAR